MKILTSIIVALASSAAMAETQVELFEVDKQGTGKSLGSVEVHQSAFGLVFTPD